jgi:rhodanese-related sulfurtransferase
VKFFNDINILLLLAALISGGMLFLPALQRRGKKVSLLQATQMINQGKTVVLDVRDPAEFAGGHVRDAINIPLRELPTRVGELNKQKAKNIIVVCEAGVRSARALGQLSKAGFAEAASLDGGIAAWQAQGLPLAK